MLNALTSLQTTSTENSRLSAPPLPFDGWWSVTRYLYCGGTVLVILGVAGVTGLLRLISRGNLFNPPGWIHWVHLGFGLFVLVVAVTGYRTLQIGLTLLGAIAGTVLGLGDLALVLHAHARNSMQGLDISDPLAHLTVGVLAICAIRNAISRASV